jgi:hypothetical protein
MSGEDMSEQEIKLTREQYEQATEEYNLIKEQKSKQSANQTYNHQKFYQPLVIVNWVAWYEMTDAQGKFDEFKNAPIDAEFTEVEVPVAEIGVENKNGVVYTEGEVDVR